MSWFILVQAPASPRLVPEIHVVFDECMSYADPADPESTRAASSSDFPQGLEPPTALIEDLLPAKTTRYGADANANTLSPLGVETGGVVFFPLGKGGQNKRPCIIPDCFAHKGAVGKRILDTSRTFQTSCMQ